MTKTEYLQELAKDYDEGGISAESCDEGIMNADVFSFEDDEEGK